MELRLILHDLRVLAYRARQGVERYQRARLEASRFPHSPEPVSHGLPTAAPGSRKDLPRGGLPGPSARPPRSEGARRVIMKQRHPMSLR